MPKKTVSSMKKKVWQLVSQYVRRKAADRNGYAACVTCGIVKQWKELQAGHFIPRAQGNACYFELSNIHCQCFRCNINLGSNGPEYYHFMLETYGQEKIDELLALSKTTRKFTVGELEDMETEFKQRLKELEAL